MRTLLMFCVMVLLASSVPALADAPREISYQGVLTDEVGLPLPDADHQLTFRLYDTETGGTALWERTANVPTLHGVFNYVLGSIEPLNLPFDQTYYVGVTVGSGDELVPRTQLTSAPYAIRAVRAEGLTDPIGADMIEPNIVSSVDGVVNDGGNIDLIAGPNISITPNDGANQITIGWSGPDWSHEESVTAGNEEVWTHNLGGDPSRYLVMMDGRESGQYYHQSNFGTNPVNFTLQRWIGAEWCCVTASTITVRRGNFDNDASIGDQWDYIRVRIFKNQ